MKKTSISMHFLLLMGAFLGFSADSIFTAQAQQISFERNEHQTATYAEVMEFYRGLDQQYDQCRLIPYGSTDFGEPLHVLVLSRDRIFDPVEARAAGKTILLINNGIHPGEPEGIDASMMLSRDLLRSGALPENLVIGIIPVYNVGDRKSTRLN